MTEDIKKLIEDISNLENSIYKKISSIENLAQAFEEKIVVSVKYKDKFKKIIIKGYINEFPFMCVEINPYDNFCEFKRFSISAFLQGNGIGTEIINFIKKHFKKIYVVPDGDSRSFTKAEELLKNKYSLKIRRFTDEKSRLEFYLKNGFVKAKDSLNENELSWER